MKKSAKVFATLALFACAFIVTSSFTFKKKKCDYDAMRKEAFKKMDPFALINDYEIYMGEKKKSESGQVKQTVILNRGVKYKFYAIQNKRLEGIPIVTIYNNEKQDFMLATTYNAHVKRFYEEIEFECKTSGNYCLAFSFQEGKEGCALGVSSFLK